MIHVFQTDEHLVALDVESGAIHLLDELAYDILKLQEEGCSREEIEKNLQARYQQTDIQEALDELAELEAMGEWNTPKQAHVPLKGDPVIKAMCLHIAHDCNLRCQYCFASEGEYQSGRSLMPYRVGKQALDFLMANSGNRQHLEVDFFGGEPLMNFETVKALVAYGRELEKKFNKKIAFTITTNCVLIDDEFIDFCDKEIHNVVLSVDGRQDIHDAVRKTVNGKGSFEAILPKAKKMALARQAKGQSYYVRGTFTRQNLDFMKDVLFLADEGFEQISVEPVVLPSEHPLALQEEDLPIIREEYHKLSQEYIERRKNSDTWFNFFHFMLDLEDGPCIAKKMSGCGAGNDYVAITPQGDIYPCHQFVGQTEFKMGSVITGEFNTSAQRHFRSCNICSKSACQDCWAKYYCSGGCSANAKNFTGDIFQPYELACQMQKDRIEQALAIYIKEKLEL